MATGTDVLLINPWIYDFAAHDLWAKPLGLLLVAGLLRQHDFQVRMIDCLEVHHPEMAGKPGYKPATRKRFGTGKFCRTQVEKPPPLAAFPRPYFRFGIAPEAFCRELESGPPPAAVLVTSIMTYWYPGVHEVIRRVKATWPQVPVLLGGTYATLCYDHARRYSGADYVVRGPGELQIVALLARIAKLDCAPGKTAVDWSRPPRPAFDLLPRLDYLCLLTSRGCPYRCPYCAAPMLFPGFVRRSPAAIAAELSFWHHAYGVRDVAFYDDALLVDADTHLLPLLAEVRRRRLQFRFHTPNGMHLRHLTPEVAQALKEANFVTIRLGLETADPVRAGRLGAKAGIADLARALANLERAGFRRQQIGVYLLCGLPGQSAEEVARSIAVVRDHGARPYLAEFSPIPGTPFWEEALRSSAYDLAAEPLYHNNTLLPCAGLGFGADELQWLKQLCRERSD